MADKNTIIARIEAIANSEKITKVELSALSREMLEYLSVEDSNDIGMLNRLLNVLTPMNRKTAVLFFSAFVHFKVDDDGTFGKKLKAQKQIDSKKQKVVDFLADADNDIWTWAAQNVRVEKKPVDFAKKITGDVSKALNAEENALTVGEVIAAVVAGGVSIEDMFQAIEDATVEEEQEEAA